MRVRAAVTAIRTAATAAVAAALLAPGGAVAQAGGGAGVTAAAGAAQTAQAAGGAADSARLDALTARVADQLRCPVCRSQSVLESSSTLAREMKAEIRRRLAAGESPEEVKAYFVSRYGEWILLRPPAEGLNLMVYVLPPLLLVGGGLLVWALLRRWSPRAPARAGTDGDRGRPDRPSPPAAPGAGPEETVEEEEALTPAEERRLEEALREDG